jgi:hypothetical protein
MGAFRHLHDGRVVCLYPFCAYTGTGIRSSTRIGVNDRCGPRPGTTNAICDQGGACKAIERHEQALLRVLSMLRPLSDALSHKKAADVVSPKVRNRLHEFALFHHVRLTSCAARRSGCARTHVGNVHFASIHSPRTRPPFGRGAAAPQQVTQCIESPRSCAVRAQAASTLRFNTCRSFDGGEV